MFSVNQA